MRTVEELRNEVENQQVSRSMPLEASEQLLRMRKLIAEISKISKLKSAEFPKNPPDNYVKFEDRFIEIISLIKETASKEDMETAKNEIIKGQKEGFENIAKILEENEELKRILNEKYSVQILFICSSLISAVLLFLIFVWFFAHIPLIHPAISIPLLIGGLCFSALSFWRMKTK